MYFVGSSLKHYFYLGHTEENLPQGEVLPLRILLRRSGGLGNGCHFRRPRYVALRTCL